MKLALPIAQEVPGGNQASNLSRELSNCGINERNYKYTPATAISHNKPFI